MKNMNRKPLTKKKIKADAEERAYLRLLARRTAIGLGIAALVLIAAEFLVGRTGSSTTDAEKLALFPAMVGFGVYVAVVMIAVLLRRFLIRPANYYGDNHD